MKNHYANLVCSHIPYYQWLNVTVYEYTSCSHRTASLSQGTLHATEFSARFYAATDSYPIMSRHAYMTRGTVRAIQGKPRGRPEKAACGAISIVNRIITWSVGKSFYWPQQGTHSGKSMDSGVQL